MSKFIIVTNSGSWWNGGKYREDAESRLSVLVSEGIVSEDDEPEILDITEV